jgi:NAD(P)-dependent dehydrogenase (short-subunit alcohol dehydrogenase family)
VQDVDQNTLPTSEDVQKCIDILEYYLEDNLRMSHLSKEQRVSLLMAAGRLSRPSKTEVFLRNKQLDKVRKKQTHIENRKVRAQTGIREARLKKVFEAPKPVLQGDVESTPKKTLHSTHNCYVCKAEYVELHHFYDSMCPPCAEFNYKKRFQTASLHGQVAVITGSRLKIGYHATLMMLRAGARVIATTRFPHDSAIRFSKEEDYAEWADRLQIYGLDLRHTPSVEIFCRYLEDHLDRLDLLLNNAAQTVRRPPGFYSHLMENELLPVSQLPVEAQKILSEHENCKKQLFKFSGTDPDSKLPVQWHGQGPGIGIRASAQLSQIPYSYDNSLAVDEVFPKGELDADLQQVDLRTTNSWRMKLADVPTPEMLEVQLVNAVAPFVLCSRLAPLMRRDYTGQKHIVNVTAMEGKFYRFHKEDRHPHTNMAKAALNMLTHTSAKDLAKDGIFINAVDTGWVTDEDPAFLAQAKQDIHDFQPPLDIVDGAARICDPFFDGILTGEHWCGKFLKDYFPIDW